MSNTHSNGLSAFLRRVLWDKTQNTFYQLIRAGVVGAICTVVDMGLMMVVHYFGNASEALSVLIGYLVGTVVNYVLGILWIFRDQSHMNRGAEFGLFCIINAIGLGINEGIVYWLSTSSGLMGFFWARCIGVGLAFIWSFAARKWGLYKKQA
nr:GtrA family protein [bacterium]